MLRSYAGIYLEEEIKSEGFVRNLSGFSRFLEAISFSHGCVLNTTNVAQECQVSRTTVNGYVKILEDLLIGFQIPSFAKKSNRRVFSQSKFYYFDAGVYRSLRPKGKFDRPEEIDGFALEGLLAQHLRAWIDYSKSPNKLFYWRTYDQKEVDFIIYGEKDFYAIEVKNTQKIKTEYLGGLKAFSKIYPEAKRYFLYRGNEILYREGILCVPCESFFKALKPNIFPFA
jgi:predicted AAA+ superfamily ATPase